MNAADLVKAALWLTSDKSPGDEWVIWFDWHRHEDDPKKTAQAIELLLKRAETIPEQEAT